MKDMIILLKLIGFAGSVMLFVALSCTVIELLVDKLFGDYHE